jgi:hypothetical protein
MLWPEYEVVWLVQVFRYAKRDMWNGPTYQIDVSGSAHRIYVFYLPIHA